MKTRPMAPSSRSQMVLCGGALSPVYFMNPIVPADVDQVLDADVFVCVPITGHEVGADAAIHQGTQRGGRGAGCPRPDGDADPQR